MDQGAPNSSTIVLCSCLLDATKTLYMCNKSMDANDLATTATATHVTSCGTTLPCLMPMHTSGQELVVMAHGGCNLEIPAETIQQDQTQSWPSRDIVSRLVGIMLTSCIKKHHVVETCYQGLITIILVLHSTMHPLFPSSPNNMTTRSAIKE